MQCYQLAYATFPIPCTQRDGNKVSSLIYTVRDGTVLSPNTLQTRTLLTREAFSALEPPSSYLAAHKTHGVSSSLPMRGCAIPY